jgi:esterase/lipase superfamily enzyme
MFPLQRFLQHSHFVVAYGTASILTMGFALITCLSESVAAASIEREPIQLVVPTRKPSLAWRYTTILFVTNRKEAEEGDDQLFRNVSGDGVTLGQACVAYPTRRRPAEQDYLDDGGPEAPARYFTIKGFLHVGTSRDFRLAFGDQLDPSFERNCPTENVGTEATPTLFIPGWRSSFTTGMTRGAQLKLDLGRKSLIVLSWPADQGGNIVQSYNSAEKQEEKAAILVQYAMQLIKDSTGEYPSIIAHSMGARLYADGINSQNVPSALF